MKSLLKSLGVIMIIVGAAILVGIFATSSDALNNNAVLGSSLALVVLGVVVHIVINKRITE